MFFVLFPLPKIPLRVVPLYCGTISFTGYVFRFPPRRRRLFCRLSVPGFHLCRGAEFQIDFLGAIFPSQVKALFLFFDPSVVPPKENMWGLQCIEVCLFWFFFFSFFKFPFRTIGVSTPDRPFVDSPTPLSWLIATSRNMRACGVKVFQDLFLPGVLRALKSRVPPSLVYAFIPTALTSSSATLDKLLF